ncbi:RHS repeat-associated core domain-containing protein, partial [Rhodococcus sp. IEGM1300]
TGRYLTPDPIKLAGGLNQYQYTPNPTGWVDPLGHNGNLYIVDGHHRAPAARRTHTKVSIVNKRYWPASQHFQ